MGMIRGQKKTIAGLGLILALLLLGGLAGGDDPGGGAVLSHPRRGILSRGSELVRGLPGFAENAFPGLYGQYRLELPDRAGPAPIFSLWLCREPLYLADAAWRLTLGGGGYSRYDQNDAAGLLIAVLPDGAEPWTALFRFPEETCRALTPADRTRLIEAWLARFLYTASLAEDPEALSLPGAFMF
jgi:hypothetical protein